MHDFRSPSFFSRTQAASMLQYGVDASRLGS